VKGTARGRFIVFEGIDASGKSTQVAKLASYLRDQGRAVHITAEPTTGPIGSAIRQAFSGRIPLDDRVIAALFVADRIDHLTNPYDGILSILDDGLDVISDRYYMSSVAYHASDVGMEWVLDANSVSTDLLTPDITIYLDLSPQAAVSRLQSRADRADKFEVLDRLEAAHRNYASVIETRGRGENIRVISALGTPEQVFMRVKDLFDSRIE